MQINIIATTLSQSPGNKYQIAEVVYKDDRGETKTKKLMSFANPATYATMKDAKQGESYVITQVKNDKGYLDWTSATKTDGSDAAAAPKAASFTSTKSSYETTEERARRQVLIVKQSSLDRAIQFVTLERQVEPSKEPLIDDVLERAQQFTDWIFDNEVDNVQPV